MMSKDEGKDMKRNKKTQKGFNRLSFLIIQSSFEDKDICAQQTKKG